MTVVADRDSNRRPVCRDCLGRHFCFRHTNLFTADAQAHLSTLPSTRDAVEVGTVHVPRAADPPLTAAALAAYRQRHASPVLVAFADWLADQRPGVLPKSPIGEAVTYATNQWPTLGVYLTDGG
jgi:hypothetical protein